MVHLCLYFCCDHLPLNRHFHFSPFLQLLLPRFLYWSGTQPLKCELLFFCVCVRCPITLATRIASVISPMHSNTADWSVFVLCGISITGCALVASAPLYIFFWIVLVHFYPIHCLNLFARKKCCTLDSNTVKAQCQMMLIFQVLCVVNKWLLSSWISRTTTATTTSASLCVYCCCCFVRLFYLMHSSDQAHYWRNDWAANCPQTLSAVQFFLFFCFRSSNVDSFDFDAGSTGL